jgi:hypothetical protein
VAPLAGAIASHAGLMVLDGTNDPSMAPARGATTCLVSSQIHSDKLTNRFDTHFSHIVNDAAIDTPR